MISKSITEITLILVSRERKAKKATKNGWYVSREIRAESSC